MRINFRTAVGAFALASASLASPGCYKYQPPSEALLHEKFRSETRETADRILLSLDVLTQKQAQDIAFENNQSLRAAYHFTNAARMRYYQSPWAYLPEVRLGDEIGHDLGWGCNTVNPPRCD